MRWCRVPWTVSSPGRPGVHRRLALCVSSPSGWWTRGLVLCAVAALLGTGPAAWGAFGRNVLGIAVAHRAVLVFSDDDCASSHAAEN